MGKIREVFQKMSLKRSLVLLAVFCLSLVSALSVITILTCSSIQKKILDTRPIIITDYVIRDADSNDTENNNGVTAVPQKYTHGELSKENQLYYWCITILMVSLPIAYIIIASFMVAKLYYKWKLKIPLENLKNGMYHISQQDLDFQIQYTSDDELGQLCDTFEHMKNEIYKSNSKMWNMLQERKALTASVSHDLRTPITVLNGYLDYLEKSIERETLTNETLQTTIKNMTEELEVSVKEIVYTKVWSYRKSVSIRLICSFWMITVMITIFASIMRLQNCSFPFLKYVTVTILYAVFLGILGLLFSQLGNNVIIGYLASLGYWSFCQFDILTEENVLYIFPIISGEIEMGKLMILMSINSFLLVVFFLSVKETRGMYK